MRRSELIIRDMRLRGCDKEDEFEEPQVLARGCERPLPAAAKVACSIRSLRLAVL
jgi:hypothetical protein